MRQNAAHHNIPKGLAVRLTPNEIRHYQAGRLEQISVRPLHGRVAAALYDVGERVWNFCAIPWRWINGTLDRDMARKTGIERRKPPQP